ncbi:MAG: hypothetical protein JOZ29_15675 [Deltaproteobacteria bacterium]|nr:hypothetical protein [Deltaproteobacteria bacterium]
MKQVVILAFLAVLIAAPAHAQFANPDTRGKGGGGVNSVGTGLTKAGKTISLSTPVTTGNGGTGTASTLTGVVRGGSPMTGAEMSGDCTTSGSNALTCLKTNGTSFGTLATAATPVSIANGGTGTASTLTGLMRGNSSAMTAAELSGDVTTSGSNAATVVQIEGAAIPTSANIVGTNGSKQLTTVTASTGLSLSGGNLTLSQYAQAMMAGGAMAGYGGL